VVAGLIKEGLPKQSLTAAALVLVTAGAALPTGAAPQKEPTWYSVVPIRRVDKPNRKTTGRLPKQQRAALLTIDWHLLKQIEVDKIERPNPSNVFRTGDLLKVAVKVNQAGYLYILNQPEGRDGVVLFPNPKIAGGRNRVVKDREYAVPDFCYDPEDPKAFPDPRNCWWLIKPPAGRDTMLVIFSRRQITTLPNVVLEPQQVVKKSVIDELRAGSEQKVAETTSEFKARKTMRYRTRVQNTNPGDNEELIATITLNHRE
jgi:hypothetical protein